MKRILFLMIFIAVVVAGWSGAWLYAAQRIKSEANAYMASTYDTTRQVDCQQLSVGGFPFRLDVTCTGFSLAINDLNIQIPQLQATALVYRPTHALIFARGPASIRDSFSGSNRQVNWTTLRASVRTNGWSLARISIEAENLQVIDNLLAPITIAASKSINLHLINDPAAFDEKNNLQTLGAFATLEAVEIPEISITDGSVQAQITLSAMPGDIRKWTPANLARNWFENQTGIDVLKFEGSDQASSFSILGNLTTTAQAMPDGNFDFTSKNLDSRFAPLLDQTGIDVIFGNPAEDGSRYQSYTVRHGVVLAGNIPLLTLAPLR